MNTVRKTRRILAAQVQNLTNQLAAEGNEGRIKLKAKLKAQATSIEKQVLEIQNLKAQLSALTSELRIATLCNQVDDLKMEIR